MPAKRKVGQINRKPGYFYFIDKNGNIYEMERPRRKKK